MSVICPAQSNIVTTVNYRQLNINSSLELFHRLTALTETHHKHTNINPGGLNQSATTHYVLKESVFSDGSSLFGHHCIFYV